MPALTARTLPSPMPAALALLAALVLVLLAATPAAAHASLEGGSVTDGQVLETAPEELFLDFNEDVVAPRSGLRVYDDAGERVDEGGTTQDPGDPDVVRTRLADGLDDGSYVVTFRVTSADGHPISGALLFSVGEEAAGADQLVGQVFTSDADRPWAIAAAVGRWVTYAGALLAAGAALVLWWLRRVIAPEVAPASRIIRTAALVAVAATALGAVVQAVLVNGDGLGALDGEGLVAALAGFYGVSVAVRMVGAGALWALARRQAVTGWPAVAAAGVLLGSLLLEGHTITTGPAAVVWPAAAVHVATGALWFGGLVVLGIALRGRRRADDPVGAGRLVARASSLFTWSVVAVVLAGSALSWVEVRALRAVLTTPYGQVLLAKLVVVLPLLALGAWNNRRLVPVLTARRARRQPAAQPAIAGGSDEVAEAGRRRDAAWAHLSRTVRIEAGLVVAVLAVTGVLVNLQPAASAAGITGAYSENVDLPGLGQMTFTVDPNRAGRNEIHLYLLGETGRPVDLATLGDGEGDGSDAVTISLTQSELDIGPLERQPIIAGPGHYVLAGPELSVPGPWAITVDVALNAFDTATATVEVTVNP